MRTRLKEKQGSIFRRLSFLQDQNLVYETYVKARRENLRLKNKILILNGYRPHLTPYPVNRLDLDLTNIDINKQVSTSLRLPNSRLSFLPSSVFDNYQYIKHLDISHNFVNHIAEDLGTQLPELEKFILTGNELTQFPLHILADMPNLEFLDISENPLDLNWIKKLLAFKRISHPHLAILF
jgi:Leucine-rich repeat (LRR) protein